MFQVRAAWELMEGGVTASSERPQVRLKPSAGCVCVCGSYTPAEPPRCVRSIVGERQFNQNTTILIAGLTVDLQQLNHEKYFLPFLLKRRVTANQKEGSSELDVNSYM